MAGKTRFEALPDVPTIADTVAGYEANSWGGVGVPRGTPTAIIEKLNREINAGLTDPTVKRQLTEVATVPMLFSPAEFGGYMASETEKWAKVVRAANIKPE
jgi:tripartite-type tricarboxylate transporter receptor subunit TctC